MILEKETSSKNIGALSLIIASRCRVGYTLN